MSAAAFPAACESHEDRDRRAKDLCARTRLCFRHDAWHHAGRRTRRPAIGYLGIVAEWAVTSTPNRGQCHGTWSPRHAISAEVVLWTATVPLGRIPSANWRRSASSRYAGRCDPRFAATLASNNGDAQTRLNSRHLADCVRVMRREIPTARTGAPYCVAVSGPRKAAGTRAEIFTARQFEVAGATLPWHYSPIQDLPRRKNAAPPPGDL